MVTLNDVKQMLTRSDGNTLTLYLNVDSATPENQAVKPAWDIWVQNTLRDLGGTLDNERRAAWKDIRARAEIFFQGFRPQSKGLAVFIGPLVELVYELPTPVENQVTFGKPQVGPLLWAIDEYEPYLIVLVDQEKSRFFVTTLGDTGFQEEMNIDIEDYDFAERTTMSNPTPTTITGGIPGAVHGGSGRDDFENMLDEHRNRFYREVAERIQKLMAKHGTQRVILGGNEQAAHAVHSFMQEKAAQGVIQVMALPMRYTKQQIFELTLPVALEYERKQEMELVNQVIDMAKSGGRGALGWDAVRQALEQQRVELLIAPWPMQDEKMSAELPEKVFESGGNIELVRGEAAERIRAEGGLAARLYYSI